MKLYTQYLPS